MLYFLNSSDYEVTDTELNAIANPAIAGYNIPAVAKY